MQRYASLLLEWNTKINLISRKDEEQIWLHHLLHSLAPLLMNMLPSAGKYIDLGTGGGLPGIPLAIMLPDSSFVLVDSIGKKIKAVEDIVARLELKNVRCRIGRIEDEADLSGTADVVLARGVTRMLSLARWAWPLLRRGGKRTLLAWKGGDVASELAEARQHAKLSSISVHPIAIPGERYFTIEDKKLIEVRFS